MLEEFLQRLSMESTCDDTRLDSGLQECQREQKSYHYEFNFTEEDIRVRPAAVSVAKRPIPW